jgi:hypothetical protein
MQQVSTGFFEKRTAINVRRGYMALHPERNYAVIINEAGTYDVMLIENGDLDGYDIADGEIGRAWRMQ